MQEKSRMIYGMEVLQMSVSKLSAELRRYSSETPELSFGPYASGMLVSNDFDVEVFLTGDGFHAEIAEPLSGEPILIPRRNKTSPGFRMCRLLIESMGHRRTTLQKVTDTIIANVSEFPQSGSGIRLSELAGICRLHVTTVSRALDNKICVTPAGHVPLKGFITGFT